MLSNNYILKWPSEVINTFKNAWGCCLSPNVVSLIPERRRREGINETKCGDKQHPNAFLKVLHYRQQGHFNIVNFFLLPAFDNEQLLLFHSEMNTFYSRRHFVKSCWFEYFVVVLFSLKNKTRITLFVFYKTVEAEVAFSFGWSCMEQLSLFTAVLHGRKLHACQDQTKLRQFQLLWFCEIKIIRFIFYFI